MQGNASYQIAFGFEPCVHCTVPFRIAFGNSRYYVW